MASTNIGQKKGSTKWPHTYIKRHTELFVNLTLIKRHHANEKNEKDINTAAYFPSSCSNVAHVTGNV